MIDVTIFTPSYNRAGYLKRLHDSLVCQSILPREWIIVDDGSTDETRLLVERLTATSPFPVFYYYQQNSGKHIAMNKGAEMAEGTLFFVVDSDDYIHSKTVELLINQWKNIQNLPPEKKNKLIGIAGNIEYENGDIVGGKPSYDTVDTDLLTYRYKLQVRGDKAEAYLLQFVRENPFPKIEGESFCPEALIFYRLAHKGYQLRFVNESIYICQYLEGGLTRNGLNTIKRGPVGTLLNTAAIANYKEVPWTVRIKHAILFWRFSFWAKKCSFEEIFQMLNNKLFLLFYPLGTIFYLRDRWTNR